MNSKEIGRHDTRMTTYVEEEPATSDGARFVSPQVSVVLVIIPPSSTKGTKSGKIGCSEQAAKIGDTR